MHPYFRKALKWTAHIALYGLALVGLFVLIYHKMGYATDTDTHSVSITNEATIPVTDVTVTIGHESFKIADVAASQSSNFTAVIDTEGTIGFSAQLGGEEIRCSFGYITHSSYDFGLGGSHTMFWVGMDGDIRVSFGTPLMTATNPQSCGTATVKG